MNLHSINSPILHKALEGQVNEKNIDMLSIGEINGLLEVGFLTDPAN